MTSSSAMFKGLDYTGAVLNNMLVVEGTDRLVTNCSSVFYWLMECQTCYTRKEATPYRALEGKSGCQQKSCYTSRYGGSKSRLYQGTEHITGSFYCKAQASAKKRRREIRFELSIDDLEDLWVAQEGKCAYTGEPLIIGLSKEPYTASLDRIDSSGHYTKDNVQFVHKTINKMKWDLSHEEFLALCQRITNHAV